MNKARRCKKRLHKHAVMQQQKQRNSPLQRAQMQLHTLVLFINPFQESQLDKIWVLWDMKTCAVSLGCKWVLGARDIYLPLLRPFEVGALLPKMWSKACCQDSSVYVWLVFRLFFSLSLTHTHQHTRCDAHSAKMIKKGKSDDMNKSYQDRAIQKEMIFLEFLFDALELFPFLYTVFSHKQYFPKNLFWKLRRYIKIATDFRYKYV